MPIVWIEVTEEIVAAGEATAAWQTTEAEICAALAAAGWFIAGGIAYFTGPRSAGPPTPPGSLASLAFRWFGGSDNEKEQDY